MSSATSLGMVAGTLTTLAFLPQVIRTWKRRSAADFSFLMLVVFVSGVGLWLIYGWLMGDVPLVITNLVTFALAAAILAMKVRFG